MPSFWILAGIPTTGFTSVPFVTSWLLPPIVLTSIRLLIAFYIPFVRFYGWGWYATHDRTYQIGHEFSYFTDLGWWGLGLYMLVAGVHTLIYTLRGRCWLDSWPRALQALHSFFYTTIVTYPIIVTAVYWAILYENPWFPVTFDAFSNVSRHGLNSLFALFEILITATNPPPMLHIAFGIFVLALYLSLAYLTHAVDGWYPYDFLDPSEGHSGRVAGYVLGIAVGYIILFLIVWSAIWLRRRLTAGRVKTSKKDIHRGTEFRPRGQHMAMANGYDEDVEMTSIHPK